MYKDPLCRTDNGLLEGPGELPYTLLPFLFSSTNTNKNYFNFKHTENVMRVVKELPNNSGISFQYLPLTL
jgi:hypothetical protein